MKHEHAAIVALLQPYPGSGSILPWHIFSQRLGMKTLFDISQDHVCATEQPQQMTIHIYFKFTVKMTSRIRSVRSLSLVHAEKEQASGEWKMYVMQLK